MPRNRQGSDGPPEGADPAVTALWLQMVGRDQEMWNRLTERDSALQDNMMVLFARLLENNSMDRVFVAGFSEIAEQLKVQMAPLRQLAPQYKALLPEDDARLVGLLKALERPDYSRPPEEDAPWIGGAIDQMQYRSFEQ